MALAVVMRYAAGSVITGQQLFHLISGEPDVVVYMCVCVRVNCVFWRAGGRVDERPTVANILRVLCVLLSGKK